MRSRVTDSAKVVRVIRVIQTVSLRGAGNENDECRDVMQYWDFQGNLLAEYDPCSNKEEQLKMKKDNSEFLDQQSYADNWREIVEEERRERVENRTRVLTSATIAAVTTLFFRLVLEPWILSLLP